MHHPLTPEMCTIQLSTSFCFAVATQVCASAASTFHPEDGEWRRRQVVLRPHPRAAAAHHP